MDDEAAPVFTAADDGLHTAELSDRWWETETAWFSFSHPERRLGGWLYTMIRPNIGTVAGGAWVWDDTAHLPWDVPYSANYSALQLHADTDLRDTTLPNGVSMRVVEPGTSYDLGYDDGDRLTLSLRFDAVMPPEPLTRAGSTFGSAHHFDQLGRVTGQLVLHGEMIAIDCLAMRDRTWGPRPEHRPRRCRVRHRRDGRGARVPCRHRHDRRGGSRGLRVPATRRSHGRHRRWRAHRHRAIRARAGSSASRWTRSTTTAGRCTRWASRSAG